MWAIDSAMMSLIQNVGHLFGIVIYRFLTCQEEIILHILSVSNCVSTCERCRTSWWQSWHERFHARIRCLYPYPASLGSVVQWLPADTHELMTGRGGQEAYARVHVECDEAIRAMRYGLLPRPSNQVGIENNHCILALRRVSQRSYLHDMSSIAEGKSTVDTVMVGQLVVRTWRQWWLPPLYPHRSGYSCLKYLMEITWSLPGISEVGRKDHRPYSHQVTERMGCDVVIHPPPSIFPKAGNGALRNQWAIKYNCQNDSSTIAFTVCDLVHWNYMYVISQNIPRVCKLWKSLSVYVFAAYIFLFTRHSVHWSKLPVKLRSGRRQWLPTNQRGVTVITVIPTWMWVNWTVRIVAI